MGVRLLLLLFFKVVIHSVNAPIYSTLNIGKAGCLHFLTSESEEKRDIFYKKWDELWKGWNINC